jgi:hypothetical protein
LEKEVDNEDNNEKEEDHEEVEKEEGLKIGNVDKIRWF